ncbi:hypothetical protein DBV15_07104 [Temnothorax longispinosus]|uniref:Uncharacterized protein n=1 Tax=Temnothorax longispinosus TaxID=300112 RepID=A0A4S2KRN9_9HYME|nr:hypothetical protein DBV15_07104 [Temnothorax longispinosus]
MAPVDEDVPPEDYPTINSNDERAADEEAAVTEEGGGERRRRTKLPVRKRVSARKVWLAATPSRRCGVLLLPLGTGINLPSAAPGPPVLATDVGVHVVRVRRRACTLVSREERK